MISFSYFYGILKVYEIKISGGKMARNIRDAITLNEETANLSGQKPQERSVLEDDLPLTFMPEHEATYSTNELPTVEAMKRDRSGGVIPGILTTGSEFLPSGRKVVDAVNGLEDGVKEGTLRGVGSGIAATVGADIFLESVTSERESLWGKIGNGFSWFFSKISSFFSSLIPGGSSVASRVQVGIESGANSYNQKAREAYYERTGRTLVFADRDELTDMFHTEDEAALDEIALSLDVNRDGKVDELELSTAKTLLDKDNSGDISAEEIQAHGGLQGAMAYLSHHHKDAIDRIEYDETFARHNLLRTLGASAQARGAIGSRFEELDKDKDGTVSRAEYRSALAALDTNGDRVIDEKERAQIQENPEAAFNLMVQRANEGRG